MASIQKTFYDYVNLDDSIPWTDDEVVVDASITTSIFIPVYLINNQLRMAMTTQTAWNEWKFLSWSIKMKIN